MTEKDISRGCALFLSRVVLVAIHFTSGTYGLYTNKVMLITRKLLQANDINTVSKIYFSILLGALRVARDRQEFRVRCL